MPRRSALAHDAAFWRKLARLGAARGPEWWVRYSPAFFGVAAAVAVPQARRRVQSNLVRVRGPRNPLRDVIDVARTFATYAGCLAEVLSNDSKNERRATAVLRGDHNITTARARGKGIVLVTAHTAGWEVLGPLLQRRNRHNLDVVMVMKPEADEAARKLHDGARLAAGNKVSHVGDPFASLELLRELRKGSIVALQLDRVPPGMKTRAVTLFGQPDVIPEGPLRLAAVSGAPLFPMFSARTGYREYVVDARPPSSYLVVPRTRHARLDAIAQQLADELARFLRAHPTQWFHWPAPTREDPGAVGTAGSGEAKSVPTSGDAPEGGRPPDLDNARVGP